MDNRQIVEAELESINAMCEEIDQNIEILKAQKQRILVIADALSAWLAEAPEQLEFKLVED